MRLYRISLLVIAAALVNGCSTFRQSFQDVLDDSRIERVVKHDPIARLKKNRGWHVLASEFA